MQHVSSRPTFLQSSRLNRRQLLQLGASSVGVFGLLSLAGCQTAAPTGAPTTMTQLLLNQASSLSPMILIFSSLT